MTSRVALASRRPSLELGHPPLRIPRSKRALDLALALPALALCLPVLLLAALAIRLTSKGPVLFRQTRIGFRERPFTLFKLRTMYVDADHRAYLEFNRRELAGDASLTAPGGVYTPPHDPRIVPVGRWLRRFSIDELPQLVNVVRGEMSLVGPRPSLPFEVALYAPEQRRRHQSLPGMTGLWQVSGRNRLSMLQMLALDLAYIERQSLALDLKILCRTPLVVLRAEGSK